MAHRQGTEIRYSADGPWITFRGKDSEATFNLRDWVRRQMSSAGNTLQRRTLREWLQAREAEGKEERANEASKQPVASKHFPKRGKS
jgi:hypothetical protein